MALRGVAQQTLEIIERGGYLASDGRFVDLARAIEAALAATKKPSRDPRWDRLPGKRGRGR